MFPDFERHEIPIGKAAMELHLDQRDLDLLGPNAKLAYYRNLMGELVYQLTTLFLSREERVDIDERWPADWIEAVKERWAPAWFLRRWPVRYRTLSVHRVIPVNICPHIAVRENQRHLEFILYGPTTLDERGRMHF